MSRPAIHTPWPNLIATLWGFAEATMFFVVPDVWFSIVARSHLRAGLIACGYGLVGALVGGALLYLFGKNNPTGVVDMLVNVPAVTSAQAESVALEMRERGIGGILLAPLSGTPYKLYAAQAPAAGISLAALMLVSVPARLARFVGVTLLTHFAIRVVNEIWPKLPSLPLLLAGWVVFYLWYWFL